MESGSLAHIAGIRLIGSYCRMISIVLFVRMPMQQPTLLLLPASVDLNRRLDVVFMTFRGNRAFELANIFCSVTLLIQTFSLWILCQCNFLNINAKPFSYLLSSLYLLVSSILSVFVSNSVFMILPLLFVVIVVVFISKEKLWFWGSDSMYNYWAK